MIKFNSINGNKIFALVDDGMLSQVRIEKDVRKNSYNIFCVGRKIKTVVGIGAIKKQAIIIHENRKDKLLKK